MAGARYRYRFVRKTGIADGYGEIVDHEVDVAREIFRRYTEEDGSIADLARWLSEQGIPTRKCKTVWDRSTVRGMLRNPGYRDQAAYATTKVDDRHRPDTARTRLRDQFLEPEPSAAAGGRAAGVFVHDRDRSRRPSQPDRRLTQRVLPRRGLQVALHLPDRWLADIHDRPSPPGPLGDLPQLTHRAAPRPVARPVSPA